MQGFCCRGSIAIEFIRVMVVVSNSLGLDYIMYYSASHRVRTTQQYVSDSWWLALICCIVCLSTLYFDDDAYEDEGDNTTRRDKLTSEVNRS